MKSNKSKVTLTLIAIALVIFGLSQCRSKDAESTPVAPVESKPAVTEKAAEPATSKAAEPAPATTPSKSADKTEKPVPAAGLPPEHRPIF
jgi:hypothetical protein